MNQQPADEHVAKAIEYARQATRAKATGQPNLAALYEKNLLREIQEARREVRQERIKRNPFLQFRFFAEDLGIFLTEFQKHWLDANASIRLKADYALVGPSKGSA